MQGGATLQFSALLYNLVEDVKQSLDYVVTGAWSQKAVDEAKKLGFNPNVVLNTKATNHTGQIPCSNSWNFSAEADLKDPSFLFFCSNETIHGVEWPAESQEPQTPYDSLKVPLVCDMSSNILSRPVDVSKYGVIFGGAQKNIGPAGVTVVIVRQDLLDRPRAMPCPTMLDWRIMADNNSMYNTPPTWSIYMMSLVFKHVLSLGGLSTITKQNSLKAGLVYGIIDKYPTIYFCPVNKKFQSKMNIPFRILNPATNLPDDALETKFLVAAEERNLVQLKGHRSVGGIRVSTYNALEVASIVILVEFMESFAMSVLDESLI